MSTPKVPPHIAKQIAAIKPPAGVPRPAGAAAAPAAAKAPAPKAAAGGIMGKLAIAGWVLAVLAGGAAYSIYLSAESQKLAALEQQAAAYEAQITQLKADGAAALKKVQDDAAASQLVMQTELDFQKLPELPLETTFRANQVLYVENKLDEPFDCKVRLFRPIGAVTRELDFTIKARTFQDIAAIDTWLFAKGDKVEFVKSGYKPRSLVVP